MVAQNVGAILQRMLAYLDRNRMQGVSNAGRVSAFWHTLLAERPVLRDLNDLLVFRRSDHTYGVGDAHQRDRDKVREAFHQAVAMMRLCVPVDYAAGLEEPVFGAPHLFRDGDILASPSFAVNLLTSWQILDFVNRWCNDRRPLHICEIGPGWGGCAYQLHRRASVASYTLVDIADNLLLSSVYLASTLPSRRLETVEVGGPALPSLVPGSVYATLPAGLPQLPTGYDLIINSFSLQEMDRESVDAYYEWIAQALSPDGLFVSLNSHGKAGIRGAEQYNVQLFHWKAFQVFRKAPAGIFNTIPYAFVLGRRRPGDPEYAGFARGAVADLMQLGLNEDIQPLADAVAAGSVTPSDHATLTRVAQLFRSQIPAERENALSELLSGNTQAWVRFLAGNWLFLQGRHKDAAEHLVAARAAGLAGFARVRAALMLALVDDARLPSDTLRREVLKWAPNLETAILDLIERRDCAAVQGHLRQVFRMAPPENVKS